MLECFKDFSLALEKVKCRVVCKIVNKSDIAGFPLNDFSEKKATSEWTSSSGLLVIVADDLKGFLVDLVSIHISHSSGEGVRAYVWNGT
jgi:hypothetical protein